ncbi:MAG: hypothetical protein IPJ23_03075 [Ignavibacteriales bacterium]|nr:hypothetical protein [Ignavibacteriales bacterium]
MILEFDFSNKFEIKDFVLDGIKFTNIIDDQYPLRHPGEPFLPIRFYQVGIPLNSDAVVSIQEIEHEVYTDKFIISTPDSSNQPLDKLNYNQEIYGTKSLFPVMATEINSQAIFRFIKTASLSISPFQFNPVERTLILNKKIILKIEYKEDLNFKDLITPISDRVSENMIKATVINSDKALGFLGKIQSLSDLPQENYWYDPNKDYYKLFLNQKGVYRITYEQLINSGISPASGIQDSKLEIFNNGVSLPIDVVDSQLDGIFNSGDYLQFIGNEVTPSPSAGMNIYNNTNVYWFSYQADTVNQFKSINGYPTSTWPKILSNQNTVRYEKDLMYEQLGYADNGDRDFWFWGKSEARDGQAAQIFRHDFLRFDYNMNEELPQAKIRVNVHGINLISCSPGHNVFVEMNDQVIDTFTFSGTRQIAHTFEKSFLWGFYDVSPDSIRILWENNFVRIGVNGNVCSATKDDYIRINWFEFDYWRWNRINGKSYIFKSPPNQMGSNNYYLWKWQADNMKVYIPQRSEMIENPRITNDSDNGVYFADTISQRTEYFIVSNDTYLDIDSISHYSSTSDLRNNQNGADYIIITHSDFRAASNRLANYRSQNIAGIENPRVKVVEVNEIYTEFSYGLVDPFALNMFVKYAFENWQSPAPNYIVLMGDMSHDYRSILTDSRPNFIPSIPYQATLYGQAPSDNNIVTVAGNDLTPELAIGRISCETLEEANLLVDKIINYPADQTKEWKQNAALFSSGLSAADENNFKFNDRNIRLETMFLAPNGMTSGKVFRYPNKPEYIPFQGDGPEIRREINKGASVVNYYGHGGGYQWDLVFTDDDILALNNENRLPFVISVTCYTAHFDNQEIFGEIFNSVPSRGSIAFLGSSGVTFWPTGAFFNEELFREFYTRKNHVIGDAILVAKSNQAYGTMLALLTLLGDPAIELAIPFDPDFVVKPADISINPNYPIFKDTVEVLVKIKNLGRTFVSDSVTVQLFQNYISDSSLIASVKLPSFGEKDSVVFTWIPQEDGQVNLICVVNEVDVIDEEDHSDNIASSTFSVFSFDKPKIVKPVSNFFTNKNKVDFIIVDAGNYVQQSFKYDIKIDTSRYFDSNFLIDISGLTPTDGVVKWSTPELSEGKYFWRVLIISNQDTNSTELESFSITQSSGTGFLAESKQLLDFELSNISYFDSIDALVLNTKLLPPRPSPETILDSIIISITSDTTEITSCTTDGTYLYYGNVSYYRDGRPSKIYKVGTGLNGSIEGFNYGSIPNIEVTITNQIFYHSDGYLYVATGDDSTLLRVTIDTGDTLRIYLPSKLLPTEDGLLSNSGFYLTSDGQFVYNITPGHGNYRNKYVLRTFDPSNNWQLAKADMVLFGISQYGFTGFFITNGFIQTYESWNSGYIRKYRLSDGFFEEEYLPFIYSLEIYSWTFDFFNNYLYAGLYRPSVQNYKFGFYRFAGNYKQAYGSITSKEIGPARNWTSLHYNMDNLGSSGSYLCNLFGKNSANQIWDTLATNVSSSFNIENINPVDYPYLKLKFDLVDSTFSTSGSLKLKSVQVNYDYFPELNLFPERIMFSSDTLLQGFPVEMSLKVDNIGYTQADSLRLDFYHNLLDTAFYTTFVNVPGDSFVTVNKSINTSDLLYSAPVSPINVNVVATSPIKEYYTFNNASNGNFNVVRDSANPLFNITFDGREIINGDIISSEPEVVITLQDNSPLPLDSTFFTLVHTYNNIPKVLTVPGPDVTYNYTPYPNSRAEITWKPILEDGRHVLEVLAKDASGNFFDSTSSRSVFNVYNNPDLLQVFNYPNPFSDNTYFTFELRGVIPPEEFKIKIFTVAGRLIRELIPSSPLQIGFNKIYWDGKDEDGDEIANGLYFYKIISKHNGEVKTVTQKLAKVK